MPFKTVIIFCFAIVCCSFGKGQSLAQNDSISVKQEEMESTEEVDGLLAFAGYLGKKLYDEVSNQFDEEQPEKKEKIKRVRIKLGPIKIERIEKR